MKLSEFARRAAFLVVGLIAGYAIARFGFGSTLASVRDSLTRLEEQGTSFAFVHPLLAYRTPEATLFGEYGALKRGFASIAAEAKSAGATRTSVYFRDLSAGQWIGVNEEDTYYPASLLKVPVMIAYYREAENTPSILDQAVAYDPSVMPDDPYDATSTLVAGRAYSLQALIGKMITDSDNGATFTLLSRINPDVLDGVYTALGIPDPGDDSGQYQISARTYALFFRILYNATYLSPAYSEKALKLLSQATFADGLVAGVPDGTPVAHKFGEHVLADGSGITGVELSDCGIVYYSPNPYLLCVMTSAKDLSSAEAVIAHMSRAAYDAIAARYPAAQEK